MTRVSTFVLMGSAMLVLLILVLYFVGALYPLNALLPDTPPDRSCRTDADCKLHIHPEWSTCSRDCLFASVEIDLHDEKVIAVHRKWEPFCPFPGPAPFIIIDRACPRPDPDIFKAFREPLYVSCIEHVCQKQLPRQ